jgi:hypothetical protein
MNGKQTNDKSGANDNDHAIFNVENNETLILKNSSEVSFHPENNILLINNLDLDFFTINLSVEGKILFGNYYGDNEETQRDCFSEIQTILKKIQLTDIDTIIFNNCNFKKFYCDNHFGLKISNANIAKFKYFAHESVDKDFYLNGRVKSIDIENTVFNGDVEIYLENNKLKNTTKINGCHFNKKLKIANQEDNYEDRQRNKAKINKLEIVDCTVGKDAYLRIGFLEVEDFSIKNFRNPQNTELNIGDCFFHNFKLTNFRNMGKFKLFKINNLSGETPTEKIIDKNKKALPTTFDINNTSIGKTDFQSINLNSFEKVIMFDNIFTEIDYTNIEWSNKDIEVGQFSPDENDENLSGDELKNKDKNIYFKRLKKQQDTYRVLKNITSRNNDQSQALIFYTKEMKNAYIIESWSNFPSKFTMWFNKNTNNFGLDWWRPIWLLLVISIFAYVLLFFSLDSKIGGFNYPNIELFFNKYLVFLDPLHKTSDISSLPWSFGSYFINFAFRIIEGLLIYQTIQAFRKYSRKL